MNKILESDVPQLINNHFFHPVGSLRWILLQDSSPVLRLVRYPQLATQGKIEVMEYQPLDVRHLSNEIKQLIPMKYIIIGNCYLNCAGFQLAAAPELDQLRIQILLQDVDLVLILFQ